MASILLDAVAWIIVAVCLLAVVLVFTGAVIITSPLWVLIGVIYGFEYAIKIISEWAFNRVGGKW